MHGKSQSQPNNLKDTFKLPDNSTRSEVRSRDGTKLVCREWRTSPPGRGTILLVPGLGEHSGRYLHVGEFFRNAEFDVLAIDVRGQGRSGGIAGYAARYDDFLDDIRAAVALVRVYPLILLGHSFGGQLVLALARRMEPNIAGYIASAPWLALTSPPPGWLAGIAALLNVLLPKFRLPTGLDSGSMSTDQVHLDSLADLDLDHGSITVRGYFEISAEADRLLKSACACAPVLIAHGVPDPVTSVEGTKTFFGSLKAPAKELKIYNGYLHELHNETGRDQVLNDYLAWIERSLFKSDPLR